MEHAEITPEAAADNKCESVAVSLIFIDEFDEMMETVEEAKKPLLAAVIDRKLNAMSESVKGIINKFEKDKYLFIFALDKLDLLKQKKFDILLHIKEIDMGNRSPVTISMGVGVGAPSLAASLEYARAALDLATGRGGDQVLIKDGDKYQFYGGQAKEMPRNTRVRARTKAYALTELVRESDRVIVMGHRNIDVDCLGAAIGVRKIATVLGKKCQIVMGEITSSVSFVHERLASLSEYETAFTSGEEAYASLTKKTLIVVVDTFRPSLLEYPRLLSGISHRIVVIDHHRKSAEFIENAVLTYHEPFASSACELVTELIRYVKEEIKLKQAEADALLGGITIDTKNFTINTSAKTFEAAALLRRSGADGARVRMFFQNDYDSYRAKSSAVIAAETIAPEIAMSVIFEHADNPSLTAAQAADELLDISGISCAIVICRVEEVVYASARSFGDINVQMIMEKCGGGGHQTVAGAQFRGKTIAEAAEMIKLAVSEYLEEMAR